MLRCETLRNPDDLPSIRDEWEKLDESLFPRTPFTGPLWNELWWRHCRKNSFSARDEFLLTVVRDAGGQMVAVAPFLRTNRPAFGPLRLREMQLFGADRHITELRSVVCRPEMQADVVAQLAAHFSLNKFRRSWVRWNGIRRDGATTLKPPTTRGRFVWIRELPDYYLDLPETWQQFETALTSRVRKKLRSSLREFGRDGHTFTLNVVTQPSDVARALDDFYRLHHTRTQVRSFDAFSELKSRSFLNDYCTEMAKRGSLRIFELVIEGNVVAVRLGFAFGRQLYLYHSGNDIAWDKYSIMTILLGEIIKTAISDGMNVLNLSTGKDRAKTRWRPQEINFVDGVEVSDRTISTWLFLAFELVKCRFDFKKLPKLSADGAVGAFAEEQSADAGEDSAEAG